jgi:hypothetical protein
LTCASTLNYTTSNSVNFKPSLEIGLALKILHTHIVPSHAALFSQHSLCSTVERFCALLLRWTVTTERQESAVKYCSFSNISSHSTLSLKKACLICLHVKEYGSLEVLLTILVKFVSYFNAIDNDSRKSETY